MATILALIPKLAQVALYFDLIELRSTGISISEADEFDSGAADSTKDESLIVGNEATIVRICSTFVSALEKDRMASQLKEKEKEERNKEENNNKIKNFSSQ